MGRRGAGEGSVFQDSEGLWRGTVDISEPTGRRRRVVVKSKDKSVMLAKMRAVTSRIDAGLPPVEAKLTVAVWVDWWLDNVYAGTVTPATEAHYRQVLRTRVVPRIGNVQLAKLGGAHVQAMLRDLERTGLAPRTVRLTRTILRRCLRDAVRWDKTTRNAASLVDSPSLAGTRLDDALDDIEAAKVLDAARGDRLEALAVVVLATGLRQGELLRLRWDDVDLDGATLSVRKAKTDAGIRTIALAPFAVTALRDHRGRQRSERIAAPVWSDPRIVFATQLGTLITRDAVLRWWWKLTIRAGVGRRRFHASRHTAATLMLNNGVPLEVVSATLGHAGLAITADVYAKVRPELQRTAATAMENLLGGSR